MRMRNLAMIATLLALAGCAAQSVEPDLNPGVNTTGTESNERQRARIHTELAAGYYGLDNLSVALEEITTALDADPNYGPAHNVAGLVYAKLHEDERAQQQFERALQINPRDPDAHNNYGLFLCERKHESQAIEHFLAALRNPLYKTPERSYVNAGLCAQRKGDLAAAKDYFESALKVRPHEPQALYQLADMAYGRGDYAEAKLLIDQLSQITSAGPAVLWLGVRTGHKLGNRVAEASYAQQLRKQYPKSKEAQALAAGKYE